MLVLKEKINKGDERCMKLRPFVLSSIIVVLGVVMLMMPSFGVEASEKNKNVDVIAHRGASGYAPENTIPAFDKAVEMHADYFEIDVQMSKDGELVLIHDNSVDRTTDGSGMVKDLTLEELQQLDAGSWFGEEFAGTKIPTFEEVLDRYRGKIGILIELKSPELYPGVEEKVVQALKERNMDNPSNGKIIIQSFNHDSVKKVRELLPNIPLGVLLSYHANGFTNEQLQNFATYADYFNPNKANITSELVERIHAHGLMTHPWTVRDRESAQFLLDVGVDGIITDFPDYVKSQGNNW